MKTVIIGGGPAGMLAGIFAKKNKDEVIILEKMNTLGRKLLITGKGRCNITSSLPIEEFIPNIPGNGKFLYSCFKNFTNQDIINLLKEQGLSVKTERGNRIFPTTDKSTDVLNALISKLKQLGIKTYTNSKVTDLIVKGEKQFIIKYTNNQKEEEIFADKVIIATGGKSYPNTGSTGDGYKIAQKYGHTIITPKASLVPYVTYEKDMCKSLQGLTLKNVAIKIKHDTKTLYEDFGEMLFTHFGVSGPIIISSSAHLIRYKNINQLMNNKSISLIIDLKPALSIEKLDLRLIRDFDKYKNKNLKNALEDLLPKKLIDIVIEKAMLTPEKKVNDITKKQRELLCNTLKNLTIYLKDFRPIEEAIITAGGIDTKQINPKTMESKLVKGLYFAGEIIDVDAYTGGFNLQIAYSTGATAGMHYLLS